MDSSRKSNITNSGQEPSLSKHIIRLEKKSDAPDPRRTPPRKSFLADLLQKKEDVPPEPLPPPKTDESVRPDSSPKSEEVDVLYIEPEHHAIPDVESPPLPPPRNRELFRRGVPSHSVPRKPRKFNKALFGVLGGIVAIGVLMGIMSTAMSRVTITVKPRVDTVDIGELSAVFDGTVAKNDLASHTIPAEFFEFTGSVTDEFPATGKSSGSTKSAGTVTIYNTYSSAPQGLVASTRFVTKGGVIFRVPESVTIPGTKIENGKIIPQSTDIQLVADQPGPGSNISGQVELRIPGFEGTPKYEGFYAVASSGFSGGNKGVSQVVSADDVRKAQEQLSKKVFDSLKQDVVRKIPPEFKLVDGLREIEITSIEVPREQTPGTTFTGTAKAVARVAVFHESDVSGLIKEVVLKNDPAKTMLPDMSGIGYQLKEMTFDKKRASVVIRGSIAAAARFSEEDIGQSLAGKKENALIDALRERKEFATFRISFFPPWMYSAPTDPTKIKFMTETPR